MSHSSLLMEALGLTIPQLAARSQALVEIAVIDSGIDATHPDIGGAVVATKRVEDGVVIEVPNGTNNDSFGHGTAVASIITRIAPNARLVDFRVLRPGNKGSGEDLVAGMRFAVRSRYRVINMSLTAPPKFVPQLIPICERAYYQDQVVVAARRNIPIPDQGIPAEFASVLGVGNDGALPQPVSLKYRSGHNIELDAPGDQIKVAAPGGGYTILSGSSFATPMVSALCALLLGAFPSLRPHEVRTILCSYGLNP